MDKLRMQVSLLVGYSGLDFCSVVQLAPSVFLSFIFFHQVFTLYPMSKCMEAALTAWSQKHSQAPLSTPASFSQKAWDTPVVKAVCCWLSPGGHTRWEIKSTAIAKWLYGIRCMAQYSSSATVWSSNQWKTVRVAVGLMLGARFSSVVGGARDGSLVMQQLMTSYASYWLLPRCLHN